MFHLELIVKGTEILFDPPLTELEGMLNRLVTMIVESGQNLPRVCTHTQSLTHSLTHTLTHCLLNVRWNKYYFLTYKVTL